MRLPFELRGGLLIAANTFLVLILAFPVQVMVARYLGPEKQGLFAFLLSFANLARVFVSVSLPDVLVTLYSRHKDEELFAGAWWLRQAAALLLSGLVLGWTALHWSQGHSQEVYKGWLILLAVGAYHLSDHELFTSWCKSTGRLTLFVAIEFFGTLMGLALRLWIVHRGGTLEQLMWSYVAEQGARLGFSVLGYVSAGRPRFRPWRARPAQISLLFSQAWPLWLSALLGIAYARIDQILLGTLLSDPSQLGQYFVANRILEALSAGAVALFIVYLPILSLRQGSDFEVQMQRHHDLSLLACLFMLVPLWFLLSPIILKFYGPGYAQAAELSLLSLWLLPVTYLSLCRSAYLLSRGLQRLELLFKMVSLLASLMLNFYAIPRLGASGAVLTNLAVQWSLLVLPYLFLPSLRPAARSLGRSLYLPASLARCLKWVSGGGAPASTAC
ncbi:MAG: oligosaccharide flippase family protein [Vulcanimicrobiota bacterium]